MAFKNPFRFYKSAPPIEPIADRDETVRQVYYWRRRILYSTMIGYAIFYIVRKNISLAMPAMEETLGIGKEQLGIFLTLSGLAYGLGRCTSGFLADLANPRFFMATGLLLAMAMNIGFGLSSTVLTLGVFWILNGWFQGMGFPPCAKSLTHWFAPVERGMKFSIWNTSHSVGAAIAAFLCGWLAMYDWRLCFFVPAGIAFVGVLFLLNRLRDTPQSLGLPPVDEFEKLGVVKIPRDHPLHADNRTEDTARKDAEMSHGRFLLKYVLGNPMIWVLAMANFCVYVVRYGVFDWGPMYLKETMGMEIHKAGWLMGSYEIGGIVGMLLSGWMMDKMKGRGGLVCTLYMAVCTALAFVFWRWPSEIYAVNVVLLVLMGVAVYGPQCLIGVIVANLASKRAAASANSITGLFGYLSVICSGWGVGKIVEYYSEKSDSAAIGWEYGFAVLPIMALVATLLLAITANATYHPDEMH